MNCACYIILQLCMALVGIHYVTAAASDILVKKILKTIKAGCIAQVETDTAVKWIYLMDDYKLRSDGTYHAVVDGTNIEYLWRPCEPFDVELPKDAGTQSENLCQNTYVGRRIANRSCSSLGSKAEFGIDKNHSLEINYEHDSKQKATLKLICDSSAEVSNLRCIGDSCVGHTPIFEYTSKYVCLRDKQISHLPLIADHNLSTGSLLLIVFGFILFIYLTGGIIRGSIKGRYGCDKLPNSGFWFELPLLVKDGCRFAFTCRKPRPFHRRRRRKEEIYEPIMFNNSTPIDDV